MVLRQTGPVVQKVAQLASKAGNLMNTLPAALEYLAKMMVEEALKVAEAFPAIAVHAFLVDEFRFP